MKNHLQQDAALPAPRLRPLFRPGERRVGMKEVEGKKMRMKGGGEGVPSGIASKALRMNTLSLSVNEYIYTCIHVVDWL